MRIGRWDSHFDGEQVSFTLGIEEQIRLATESMARMEDEAVLRGVVAFLRGRGWTVLEPDRREPID